MACYLPLPGGLETTRASGPLGRGRPYQLSASHCFTIKIEPHSFDHRCAMYVVTRLERKVSEDQEQFADIGLRNDLRVERQKEYQTD